MSGLKNTAKRFVNASLGRGYQTRKEARIKRETADTDRKNKTYQNAVLPDEEEIRLTERRKSARYRGSRAKTILTDRETLG